MRFEPSALPRGPFARTAAAWLLALGFAAAATGATSPRPQARGPSHVRIVAGAAGYALEVNGQPFWVRGAGLESGSQEALAAAGGNAFRTWRSDDGKAVLDRARRNGLFVALGLEVARERHGFDYDDPVAVAAQKARIRAQVLKYKDHPALLLWLVGNELNLGAHNPKVWDAVNDIAAMIHQLDPNHPVSTPLAGLDPELLDAIRTRAPALDLLSFQLYGDIGTLPARLRASHWTGPYLITEWGPTGHWESPLTPWGAAIEADASSKAAQLTDRYRQVIAADARQCLGSFVFLWGNKQERTPTWYGLFLATGEATPSVDAMHYLWTGAWPANRSPAIEPLVLAGRPAARGVHLQAGQRYEAQVRAHDPDGDRLRFRWQIRRESDAQSMGGDSETVPPVVPVPMTASADGHVQLRAPEGAGAYRLFVTVADGRGHAAYANFPFFVDAVATTR